MAHQTHNLPWQVLADNFKYVYECTAYHNQTNLYPRWRPAQSKELKYFATAFARTLDEHTRSERAKYAQVYEPPGPDDEVLSEMTVDKIWQTMRQCETRWGMGTCPTFSAEDRKLWFWINHFNDDNKLCCCHDAMELCKVLVLHNEMDAVLRAVSHPSVILDGFWACFWHSSRRQKGWIDIVATALFPYICLNVLFLKPELHDAEATRRHLETRRSNARASKYGEVFDYRLTRGYQEMVTNFISSSDVPQGLPHKLFFGCTGHPSCRKSELGRLSIPSLNSGITRCGYSPHSDDIPDIIQILGQKGLPVELSFEVLELADYKPGRRTRIPHDPLHRQNQGEMRKYLNFCWQLLVRSNMLVQSQGLSINWERSVSWCIWELFGVPYPKMVELGDDPRYNSGDFALGGIPFVQQ